MKTEDDDDDAEPVAVPIADVENRVIENIREVQRNANGRRCHFVFDGFLHQDALQFIEFTERVGKPQFVITLNADKNTIENRYKIAKELDEIDEDTAATLQASAELNQKNVENIKTVYAASTSFSM